MSYAAAAEPFRAANLLAGREIYHVTNLSVDGISAEASSGARIPADQRYDNHEPIDYLFVVAGGNPWAFDNRRTFAFLQRLAAHGVRLGGISGGPVILARAGLMAGRRLTTHWDHAQNLIEAHPDLLLERSIFVIDRDRFTCAGGTAPMDMMHAIISEQWGAVFARKVSDWFLHTDIRPSEGPQRASLIERYQATHPGILNAIEAMQTHVANPLDLGELASMTGIGARQLNRLFADRFGMATMRFYRQIRLETACGLLTGSSLPITEIALATGFSDAAHLSRVFKQQYGRTPRSWRKAPARTASEAEAGQ